MATTVAEIQARLELVTGKFDAAVARSSAAINSTAQSMETKLGGASGVVNEKMSALGATMATFVKTTAIAGAAAFSAFGAASLKSASDLQQSRIAFETMLGSADKAQEMLRELEKFALRTPFTLPQVQEGAKSLLAYGISAEKIIPTFNALGNIAAGVGRDKLPQLTLAFGQVKAAGRLTGMELRQFTEAGVPLIDELAKSMGKSAAEIKQMVEDGKVGFPEVEKALFSLSGEGGRFGNLMEKQSKTLGGITSNIVDSFGKIGRAFLGMDSSGNVAAGSLFDRIQKGAEKLQNWLAANQGTIAAYGKIVGESLVVTFETLAKVIGVVIKVFSELWTFVSQVATQIWTFIKPAVDALVIVFNFFWNVIQNFLMPALAKLWEALQPFIPILQWIAIIIGTVVIVALLLLITIVTAVATVIATVVAAIATAVGWLAEQWANFWYAIGSLLYQVWEGIKSAVSSALEFLKNIIQGAVNAILAVWSGIKTIVGVVVNAFGNVVNAVGNGISAAYNKVKEWVSNFVQAGKDIINGIVKGLKEASGAVIEFIKGVCKDALNAVKSFFGISSPSKVMAEVGKNLMQGMALGITKSSGLVDSAMQSVSGMGLSASMDVNSGGAVSPQTGGNVYNINLKGVMARSQSDLREIGIQIVKAVDEQLVSENKQPIMGDMR